MTFSVTPVTRGRGAWSNIGGTLSDDGSAPGSIYTAPNDNAYLRMPGVTTSLALKKGTSVDVNTYAVYCAVRFIQRLTGATVDGELGNDTKAKIIAWQTKNGLVPDGQFGPASGQKAAVTLLNGISTPMTTDYPSLRAITRGHMSIESGFDPGAVGVTTPDDLGYMQINGPAHPDMTMQSRFDPYIAIPWAASFVYANWTYMYRNRNDGIAAYNLGKGGASSWVKAGRPQMWGKTDVWKYISIVLKAAGL